MINTKVWRYVIFYNFNFSFLYESHLLFSGAQRIFLYVYIRMNPLTHRVMCYVTFDSEGKCTRVKLISTLFVDSFPLLWAGKRLTPCVHVKVMEGRKKSWILKYKACACGCTERAWVGSFMLQADHGGFHERISQSLNAWSYRYLGKLRH